MELLHIYAQDSWHQEATIVGNRAALERLVAVLHRALEMDAGIELSTEVFANDGEGYECRVIRLENETQWDELATPYTDEMCQGTNEGRVYP